MENWKRTDYLKYHVRQWEYQPREIRAQFHNDVREYISYLVRKYPGLNRV